MLQSLISKVPQRWFKISTGKVMIDMLGALFQRLDIDCRYKSTSICHDTRRPKEDQTGIGFAHIFSPAKRVSTTGLLNEFRFSPVYCIIIQYPTLLTGRRLRLLPISHGKVLMKSSTAEYKRLTNYQNLIKSTVYYSTVWGSMV